MNNNIAKISLVIAALALCLAGTSLFFALKTPAAPAAPAAPSAPAAPAAPGAPGAPGADAQGDIQYVLYLGTNDKDTNQPVFAPDESKRKLEEILIDHMGGYTIQEATGGWKSDDGKEYQEYTLVIYLSDTDIDTVHKLCDELISVYHQSSVLIQSNKTSTEFYAG
jgi:hypothetical protein